MLRQKPLRFLLLVKIKVSNFIGKSFNLHPHACSTGGTTPLGLVLIRCLKKAFELICCRF